MTKLFRNFQINITEFSHKTSFSIGNHLETSPETQSPNVILKLADSFEPQAIMNNSSDILLSDFSIGNEITKTDILRGNMKHPPFCFKDNDVITCSQISIILLLVFNLLLFLFMLSFNIYEMIRTYIRRTETLKKFKDRF